MLKKLICFTIFYSISLKAVTITDNLTLCTSKTSLDFQNRLASLDSVKDIDQTYSYSIEGLDLIKIRALDMIKSQTYNKNGKFYWLLEFRPMPDHTSLSTDFYPRIILNCNKGEKTFNCKPASDLIEKMRIFTNFEFNLSFVSGNTSLACKSIQNNLVVQYTLSIDDQEFEDLKKETYTQMVGNSNGIIVKFMDILFNPEKLFQSYIMNLYSHW